MTDIQQALDNYMRETHLQSVTDMVHIAAEDVIVVFRKMGARGCIINIRGDKTTEDVIKHLESVPAIY